VNGWLVLVGGWLLVGVTMTFALDGSDLFVSCVFLCCCLWFLCGFFVVSLFVSLFVWLPGDATDLFVSGGRANRGGSVCWWYIGARWFLECGGFGGVYGKEK
tara:strand:- start:92 stop:397 length:306 start_codon:yes stop_codon:yes gene_type:complete